MMSFFCFKQKTAYEMRISDWSSDVCSSDLPRCDGDGGTMARAGSRGETRALLPDVASRYLRRRAEEIGGVVLVALAAALAVALVGFDAAGPSLHTAGVASGPPVLNPPGNARPGGPDLLLQSPGLARARLVVR